MSTGNTVSSAIALLGSMLADRTRVDILCALMDGRAHTGSELARHVGVAASTASEHLSKLIDANIVSVEPQGRHRYWRLVDSSIARLLEDFGASTSPPSPPKAPANLAYVRTCYDHLAGAVAVAIYEQLEEDGHLVKEQGNLKISPSGIRLFTSVGVDTAAILQSNRQHARPCLDWTQRRHHLAGAGGKELLSAMANNGWIRSGSQPRSVHITNIGRNEITRAFALSPSRALAERGR